MTSRAAKGSDSGLDIETTMPAHAVIAASVSSSQSYHAPPPGPFYQSFPGQDHSRRVSYGATSRQSSPVRETIDEEDEGDGDLTLRLGDGFVDSVVDESPALNVSWTYLSRLYLLIPASTLLFFIGLVLLITFAWPPTEREREEGQSYPHPIFWKPFLIGVFASCTVQTLRVPIWVILSWLCIPAETTNLLSTAVHTVVLELLRLSSIPLITRSPSSGFHSTYYLGLGWGAAEVAWGIVQGYEQLSLYEDTLSPQTGNGAVRLEEEGSDDDVEVGNDTFELLEQEAVTDLERKVEILERARARRDLEEVIGVPYPTIPFPLHILWRIDTLLLNLGLTLILSAFYFDPFPLYEHPDDLLPPYHSNDKPSRFLWPVWVLVACLHVVISLMWKIVGRVGIEAVTWGGLIVALGSVFAGLGAWGGLV